MTVWQIEDITQMVRSEEQHYRQKLLELEEEIFAKQQEIAQLEDEKAEHDADIAYTRIWRGGLAYCACACVGLPIAFALTGGNPFLGVAAILGVGTSLFTFGKSISLMNADQNRDPYGRSLHKFSIAISKDIKDEIKELQKEIKKLNKEKQMIKNQESGKR